jgi:hypothetical protein
VVAKGPSIPVVSTPPTEVISWSVGSDGTLLAQCSGQQLSMKATQQSDGSVQRQLVFSRSGQAPYLTITSVVQDAQRNVSLTLAAGSSQLTLAITGIDRNVTSGSATVSGSFNGTAVNWSGSVNLSANPVRGTPIPGWPAGAFGSELATASVFAPLASVVNTSNPTPTSTTNVTSPESDEHSVKWNPDATKDACIAICGGPTSVWFPDLRRSQALIDIDILVKF